MATIHSCKLEVSFSISVCPKIQRLIKVCKGFWELDHLWLPNAKPAIFLKINNYSQMLLLYFSFQMANSDDQVFPFLQ